MLGDYDYLSYLLVRFKAVSNVAEYNTNDSHWGNYIVTSGKQVLKIITKPLHKMDEVNLF